MSENRSGNLFELVAKVALAAAVYKAGDKLAAAVSKAGDKLADGMKAAAPSVGAEALKPFVGPAESLASSAAAGTDLASRGWPWWVHGQQQQVSQGGRCRCRCRCRPDCAPPLGAPMCRQPA